MPLPQQQERWLPVQSTEHWISMSSTKQNKKWIAIAVGTHTSAAIGGLLTRVLKVNDTGLLVVMTGLLSATISVYLAQGRSEKT